MTSSNAVPKSTPNSVLRLREHQRPFCIVLHFSDMIADILMAKSRIERCSSAPSTSRLSTSEKTRTILFFWESGIVSSYVMAW